MTNPTGAAGVSAGWHVDPTGRHQYRYWDGNAWTDAVADDGRTATDPPLTSLPQQPHQSDTPADSSAPTDSTPAAESATPADTGAPAALTTADADGVAAAVAAADPQTAPTAPAPVAPAGSATPQDAQPAAMPTTDATESLPVATATVELPAPTGGSFPPPQGAPVPGPVPAPPYGAAPTVLVPPAPRRQRPWWIIPVALAAVLVLVGGITGWVLLTRPGPAPEGLASATVTSSTVTLRWSRPKTGAAPERYVVQRNGKEVARVKSPLEYHDTDLAALTDYRYTVIAYAAGKESSPSKELRVRTRPSSPSELASGEVTADSVTLTWSAPKGPRVDHYVVRRDGVDVGTVPAGTLNYRDTGLKPLSDLKYTVIAVTQGLNSDPALVVRVTTKAPPVDQARLQDSWDVTLTVSKTDGTKLKVGDSSPETWTFTPKCPTGPCDVDLAGTLGGQPFTMTLTREGAVYRGEADAHIAKCGSTQATNTLSLTVRVTDGHLDGAAWAASTWESSLELSIPYTRDTGNYYCPSQSAQFTVKPEGATATPNT